MSFVPTFGLCLSLLTDVTVGGARPVTVHVPPSYDPAVPIPVVILLHGFGGDGNNQESYWGVRPLSDAWGFLYAHPDGTTNPEGSRFWNATDVCCNVSGARPDDSSYLRSILDEIEAQFNVDRDRVCFGGLSNGGFMSYRMACDHADQVTAIASQAGATFDDPAACVPNMPVHVLQIHGSADDTILYAGGPLASGKYPGAVGSVERWAAYDGCSIPGQASGEALDLTSDVAGAETTITSYTGDCRPGGSVELWTMRGAGHVPNLVRTRPPTSELGFHVVEWLLSHPRRTPPVASFTVTQPGGAGTPDASLDGSSSTAPAGTSLAAFKWDFGDGTKGDGMHVSHAYSLPGRYIASLRVLTDDGRVSIAATHPVIVVCPSGDIEPWLALDMGEPAYPGSARLEAGDSGETLAACAGGRGYSSKSDQLFLVHQEIAGDFQITAGIPRPAISGAKVGLMARASLDAGAPFAAMGIESTGSAPASRFRFRYRNEANATPRSQAGATLDVPLGWVRLERRGDNFSGSVSLDGTEWTTVHETSVGGIPSTALVGVVVAANDTRPDLPLEAFQTEIVGLKLDLLPEGASFRRGDANGDGNSDISDPIFILGSLFLATGEIACRKAGDANDDGGIDVSDPVMLLNHFFLGAPAPPRPFPDCGADGTEDGLSCEAPGPCE